MRRAIAICAAILVIAGVCGSAQQRGSDAGAGSDYVGTWVGTWEGGGTGSFVLTLEKGEGGKLGGKLSVTDPTYDATFKTVSFDGNRMTATYDFPPDPQTGIVITGTFEGASARGTWAARQGTADIASGTWTVKRK